MSCSGWLMSPALQGPVIAFPTREPSDSPQPLAPAWTWPAPSQNQALASWPLVPLCCWDVTLEG